MMESELNAPRAYHVALPVKQFFFASFTSLFPLFPSGQSSPINHRCAGGGSRLERSQSGPRLRTDETRRRRVTPIYCRLIAPTAAFGFGPQLQKEL